MHSMIDHDQIDLGSMTYDEWSKAYERQNGLSTANIVGYVRFTIWCAIEDGLDHEPWMVY